MELHSYRVTALGHMKSGKTTLLASMHRAMLSRTLLRPFSMTASSADQADLNGHFYRLSDPSEPFPAGTDGIRKYNFTIRAHTEHGKIDAARVHYVDYRGEDLGRLTDAARVTAEEELGPSHAFLGILDGLALLRLMDGGDEFAFERDHLANSLQIAELADVPPPFHFVITKWDLLQERGIRLGQVRACLAQNEVFLNFVRSRAEYGATVRLIPVSAVGRGFARLADNDEMVKTGERIRPFQVDIPLLAVVPDYIRTIIFQFFENERLEPAEHRALGRRILGLFRGLLGGALGADIGRVLGDHKLLAGLTPDLLNLLLRFLEESLARAVSEQRADEEQELQKVVRNQEAVKAVLNSSIGVLQDFEARNPDSLLADNGIMHVHE
jgi:hypothetical protein